MLSNEESLLNKKKHQTKKKTELVSQEDVYTVESIREKKRIKNKWYYNIKWFNYPEDQNTWEPKENLMCEELLAKFEKNWKMKKQQEKMVVKEEEIIDLNENSESSKSKVVPLEIDESLSPNMKKTNRKKEILKAKLKRNTLTFQKKNYKEENFARDNNIKYNSESNQNITIDDNRESHFESKGCIEINKPKRILSAKLKEDKTLEFLVMWKKRAGFKPLESYVSNDELKKHKYFDLIIDFYEMRTRFHNEQNDSKKAGNSNDSTHENK